jgi:hypothetical protein
MVVRAAPSPTTATRFPQTYRRVAAAVAAALADRWMRVLSIAFVVGQLFDALTTHVALASGRFQEANPLFAGALQSSEVPALLFKVSLAMVVLVLALTKLSNPRRTVVMAVLALISLEAPATNALRMFGVM